LSIELQDFTVRVFSCKHFALVFTDWREN